MTRLSRLVTLAIPAVVVLLLGGVAAAPKAAVRILLVYDLEGASHVLDDAGMDPALPDSFARGRSSLVEDVNAVVAGLFDGGATAVDVFNSHGYGDDTLVSRSQLDPRARILSRPTPNYAYNPAGGLPDSGYQAVVTVGMHDKPLSGGFSPHTLGAGLTPVINGAGLTETELVGYCFGTKDVPVIFASGDDRLRQTLATAMPWVEYVAVKRVVRPLIVEPMPIEVVRRDLRAGARRALQTLGKPGAIRPMRLASPIRAGLLATYPAWLPPGLASLPGVQRSGDTVTFVAPDYGAAVRGIGFLVAQASRNFAGLTIEYLRGKPQWSGALREAQDTIRARSRLFEQGEWKP